MNLLENYLQFLYQDNRQQAKEWRGSNIPYGDDSNRLNLIRQCMTLECNRMKINCLRKLRDQAAMNPFYQARLDRFVDAITGIYEPTNNQGTIPGNEFKSLVESTGSDIITTSSVVAFWVLLIMIAHSLYMRIFRKAAKNCRGLSTFEKNHCMKKYKINAVESEINFLKNRKMGCKKTKTPQKCLEKVNKRIQERTNDLIILKKKYEEWSNN